MAEPEIFYDEPADTLYISFAPGERATGIELNENVLLRIDKQNRRAVGITLLSYSFLIKRGNLDPSSLPLTGLEEVSPELRELALEILRSPPVNEYLALSVYRPAGRAAVPLTTVKSEKLVARAA